MLWFLNALVRYLPLTDTFAEMKLLKTGKISMLCYVKSFVKNVSFFPFIANSFLILFFILVYKKSIMVLINIYKEYVTKKYFTHFWSFATFFNFCVGIITYVGPLLVAYYTLGKTFQTSLYFVTASNNTVRIFEILLNVDTCHQLLHWPTCNWVYFFISRLGSSYVIFCYRPFQV